MAHSIVPLPAATLSANLRPTLGKKNAAMPSSTPSMKASSYIPLRREFVYGMISVGIASSVAVESADAAARRQPPPPPEEKKDPSITGLRAKVLASIKRKEAMKDQIAKLRERGKPVNR